jgi:hypothetical protein
VYAKKQIHNRNYTNEIAALYQNQHNFHFGRNETVRDADNRSIEKTDLQNRTKFVKWLDII